MIWNQNKAWNSIENFNVIVIHILPLVTSMLHDSINLGSRHIYGSYMYLKTPMDMDHCLQKLI
jgi:hypothetical protein